MNDPEITNRIRNGDHSAIQWLFNQYYVGLCTYAQRFLKQKSEAEEVVQHTFFKLWEKREVLPNIDSFVTYLFKSVKNNCLNHIKHLQIVNKFNTATSQKLQEAEDILTISQETGLSIYIANELESKITEAIEHLPKQCREIFIMSRFDGLKHMEIAEKKGITLNTVQKQISIALEKLKTALNSYLSIVIVFIIKILY